MSSTRRDLLRLLVLKGKIQCMRETIIPQVMARPWCCHARWSAAACGGGDGGVYGCGGGGVLNNIKINVNKI